MLSGHEEKRNMENTAVLECAGPSCKQENPCPGGMQLPQSPQMEVVCMQLKPVPQEFRRAMVIGHNANRKWLTAVSLQSNTVITAYNSAVCHGEDGDKDSDEEDSKERKRKAMDRIVSKIMISGVCPMLRSFMLNAHVIQMASFVQVFDEITGISHCTLQRRENEEKRLRQNAANMNKGLDVSAYQCLLICETNVPTLHLTH